MTATFMLGVGSFLAHPGLFLLNPRDYPLLGVDWNPHIFWRYLFYQPIIGAAVLVVVMAVIAQAAGIVLGLFAALGRLSTFTLGRRFMAQAVLTWLIALDTKPLLDGEFNKFWSRDLGPNPPGGAETWLVWVLVGFGAVWLLLGIIGMALPRAPSWIRWIGRAPWYPLRSISGFYLWIFRGTPLLVQIGFFYFALSQATNNAINLVAVQAAVVALSINEGAYMAEIIRAGILSVDSGQVEAASSLGMTSLMTMRRVVLPQAVRFIIPPTGNEFISMLKNTSLASVISTEELVFQANQIGSALFRYFEPLIGISCWYLAMTTVATYLQVLVEGHFEQGFVRNAATPGVVARFRERLPINLSGRWPWMAR